MDKKILGFLILGFTAVLFIFISLFVVLSRKHRFFIRQKLKWGALLITLSAPISSCAIIPPPVTCYAPLPMPPKEVPWASFPLALEKGQTLVRVNLPGVPAQAKALKYQLSDLVLGTSGTQGTLEIRLEDDIKYVEVPLGTLYAREYGLTLTPVDGENQPLEIPPAHWTFTGP